MNTFKFLLTVIALLISKSIYPQQNTGTIAGKIIDKETKQSLYGGQIILKENNASATSDSSGQFNFNVLDEGVYNLIISFAGYQEKVINDVRVTRNKTFYIEIEIEKTLYALQNVKIKANAFKYENNPTTPVSTYSFSREEISRNPGAQGDIFRAIGMLPGVSSTGGEYSAIAVRGQGVRDNVYMVDDIPVTQLGHLEISTAFNDPNGGRFSIFAPRVIDGAQFQGGGISAQFGRRSASYLGLTIKEGNKKDYTFDGQLDLLGFTINYDGPSYFHKKTSLFVSSRYQDFNLLFSMINLKEVGIPTYSDHIFKSTTQLGKKHKLSLIAIVSPDSYIKDIETVKLQKELMNASLIDVNNTKNIFGINLRTLTGSNSYWKNILYYTRTKSDLNFGMAYPKTDSMLRITEQQNIPVENNIRLLKYSESELGYRSVFNVNFKNNSKFTAGLDISTVELKNYRWLSRPDTSYLYGANDYRPDTSKHYTVINPAFFNADYKRSSINSSIYCDYSVLLLKKLTINLGLRYDYTGLIEHNSLSPRISGSLRLNSKNTINFAAGIYYQDPVYSEIADQPMSKKLKAEKVSQLIVGYKKHFTPDLKLTIEGWYKSLDDLIVRPARDYREQVNAGTGWASGFDINLIKRLTKRFHGQLAYSYMQSKRNDNNGVGEYNYAFSQPHQVNALISYKAGKKWILASKFRYATGKPTDSYIIHANIFNDPKFMRYSMEITGKNTERFNDFMSLDIRADYRFTIKRLGLTTFIDIVNIMNRQNENGRYLNPYTGKIPFTGLAIFPTFGLKFEY